MKLALILAVVVLIALFIIWNYVGSGENHKSKNVNRILDLAMVVSLLIVLFLSVSIWYSSKEEELLSDLNSNTYAGEIGDEVNPSEVANYQEMIDSENRLSQLKDAIAQQESQNAGSEDTDEESIAPTGDTDESEGNVLDGLKELIPMDAEADGELGDGTGDGADD